MSKIDAFTTQFTAAGRECREFHFRGFKGLGRCSRNTPKILNRHHKALLVLSEHSVPNHRMIKIKCQSSLLSLSGSWGETVVSKVRTDPRTDTRLISARLDSDSIVGSRANGFCAKNMQLCYAEPTPFSSFLFCASVSRVDQNHFLFLKYQ